MAKGKFFSGDYRLVIVKVIAIAVILFILWKIAQKLFAKKTGEELQEDMISQNSQDFITGLGNAQAPPTMTGEVQMPSITVAEAGNIANIQYDALSGYGTDEASLFNSLCGLNGADLILVAQEFDIRDEKTIFQWYYNELCSSVNYLTGCNGWTDNDGSCGVAPDCDQNFAGLGGCSELVFMKKLWAKSGLAF